MCGIAGASRITPVTQRMLGYMMWDMESRGKDSWGATNGEAIIKHLGPITNTWYSEVDTWAGWERGIFHTRAASTGAVTLENQHPFIIEREGRVIVGIHNGVIVNHEQLNHRYNRSFDCDSPHVFMAIAGFSPTTEIYGYGNLAWYVRTAGVTPELHLAKFNGDNLFVACMDTGEVVFCSMKESIVRAAGFAGTKVDTFINVQGDMEYVVHATPEDPAKDSLYQVGSLPFGTRGLATASQREFPITYLGSHVHNRRSRSMAYESAWPTINTLNSLDRMNNICGMSRCMNKVTTTRRRELICPSCMTKAVVGLADDLAAEAEKEAMGTL